MFCTKCQNPLVGGSQLCVTCGYDNALGPLPQTATATLPPPSDQAGANAPPAPAPRPHPRPVYHPHSITPDTSDRKWGTRAVIAVIVLTAVGFAGYGVWQWRQTWLANHISWTSPPVAQAGMPVLGLDFSCTLVQDGRLLCWGSNDVGQLGDTGAIRIGQPTTVLAAGITQLDAGDRHACARTRTGEVLCWGSNVLGQLGAQAPGVCRTDHGEFPCAVLPQRAPAESALMVVSGVEHNCTLHADSTVSCWGRNDRGQLGVPQFAETTMVSRPAAATRFASLTAGGYHTCGLLPNGQAMCWGWNVYNQLATRTRAELCGFVPSRRTPCNPQPVATAPALRFQSLAAGREHTCGLDAEGKAWCWGSNNHGELGGGTMSAATANPVSVAGGRSYQMLAAGESFTCGLAADGKVFCWGAAMYHQLGTADSTINATPVEVPLPEAARSVGVGPRHACAITVSARVYCWGDSQAGQTGNVRTLASPWLREAGPPANAAN